MSRYQHTRDERGRFKRTQPPGLCVYCGRITTRRVGGVAACASHRDLPTLDPLYAESDQWTAAR